MGFPKSNFGFLLNIERLLIIINIFYILFIDKF